MNVTHVATPSMLYVVPAVMGAEERRLVQHNRGKAKIDSDAIQRTQERTRVAISDEGRNMISKEGRINEKVLADGKDFRELRESQMIQAAAENQRINLNIARTSEESDAIIRNAQKLKDAYGVGNIALS